MAGLSPTLIDGGATTAAGLQRMCRGFLHADLPRRPIRAIPAR